ncbi:MAG: hypothetical protein AVDCRST_MAG91-3622 [uncultured Sphingomonadaceae bacterium]|uniref:Uncharacterized protein n=1 Tax=uncultured Sphingomonadaceae bacterium TaxID=169976 RepID=A0A6J4U230_9SPHN|nr:MAG: hypothetical protein AVDCRST_MAG91-3622 [uncultured Sphingomonadaceae bacterium]
MRKYAVKSMGRRNSRRLPGMRPDNALNINERGRATVLKANIAAKSIADPGRAHRYLTAATIRPVRVV